VFRPPADQELCFSAGATARGTSTAHQTSEHRFDTVLVGGGQADLAGRRVCDAQPTRWDSPRLFTPAFGNGLPDPRFPAAGAPSPPRANRPPTG
jgi:hypothetical protein